MDWYSYFLLGNLIADTAIAIFAYKVSIFDRKIDKLFARLRYLRILKALTIPTEIKNDDDSKRTIENDPLDLSDEFVINLELNIFQEDKERLLHFASFTKMPIGGMEIQKYTIYNNKEEIPKLIKNAENDYQKMSEGYFNTYILNNLLYMFFIGIILQLLSWLYGSLDP